MSHPLLLPLTAVAVATLAPAPDFTQEELEALSARISGQVEVIRGDEFKRPVAVRIEDTAGFIDYAKDRMERTTTEDQMWADEVVMKALGVFPAEKDMLKTQMELLESQVGGFYDPQTDSFALMKAFDGGLAKVILAHELTHALDDQLYDIDGMLEKLEGNADAQLAYHAVVEGSGTATMADWVLAHMGEEITMEDMTANADMGTAGLEDAPAALWKPLMMVYLRGAAFLKRSDNVGAGQNPMQKIDRADLERAFMNPPRSTEQVLHPEKYWDEKYLDEPKPVEIDTTAAEADGWTLVSKQTLGEAVLALATSRENERGGLDVSNQFSIFGVRYTNRAAEGWGGDRYIVMKKGEQVFFRLSTVWDTKKDADQFYERMDEQYEHLSNAHRHMVDPVSGRAIVSAKLSQKGDAVTYDVLLSGDAALLTKLRGMLK